MAVFAAETPVSVEELKKTLSPYEKIEKLEVPFHQTKTLVEMKIKLESDGRLTLNRAKQTVLWEILKPSPLKVEMTATEIKLTDENGTQTLKTDAGPAAQSLKSLVAWLKLDAEALAKEDDVFLVKPRVYLFKPRDRANSPFESIELTLGEKNHLKSLFMKEKSGDSMQIDFGTPKITANAKKK